MVHRRSQIMRIGLGTISVSSLFLVLLAEITLSDATFKYQFEYTSYVREVGSSSQNRSESSTIDMHICQLSPEKKLKICQEALKEPTANQSRIVLVHRPVVLEEKIYEFALTGWNNIGKPPVTAAACVCSTTPPIYLRDVSCENNIIVYISFRDTYVSVPVKPPRTLLRVCQMQEEEILQMCREMWDEPTARNYAIQYVEGYGAPVLEERMYEIKLTDPDRLESPLIVAACMCPTRPLTYLCSKFNGKQFFVYVALRDELYS